MSSNYKISSAFKSYIFDSDNSTGLNKWLNLEAAWNAKKRVGVIFALVILIVGYKLREWKPFFIVNKSKSNINGSKSQKQLNTYKWIEYTIGISLLLYILILYSTTQFKLAKQIVLGSSCNNNKSCSSI